MSRYIEADSVEKAICKRVYAVEVEDILAEMANAPTIDIVRCKECYMCDEEMWCSFYDSIMESDDYCSYGDRKSDE